MEIIIAALLGCILIVLLVGIVRQSSQRHSQAIAAQAAAMIERERRAVWAGATVVSIISDERQHDPHGSSAIELHLRIQPPEGEPYGTRTRWSVDDTARSIIQPGAQLPIKIDAHEPKIIYPNINGATYQRF